MPKKKELGQFADLKGNLAKKRRGCIFKGGRAHYEYVLDNPVFGLAAILKSINKVR